MMKMISGGFLPMLISTLNEPKNEPATQAVAIDAMSLRTLYFPCSKMMLGLKTGWLVGQRSG